MERVRNDITEGRPQPLGATLEAGGINFSIYSEYAASVELLLFSGADAHQPNRVVRLDPDVNHSFHFWHCYVPGLKAGQVYAYRLGGPTDTALTGRRYDPEKVLLDPFARGNVNSLWDRGGAVDAGDNVETSMRSVVIDPTDYDWEGDSPLRIPLGDTVIYETHVRGFTRSPTSASRWPGTFRGLIDKIPHLQRLGVTAVELMPTSDFDETQILRCGPDGTELRNYWGYDPYGHFAPQSSYCVEPHKGNHQREFRDMVKALHRAGIELILDVVFNHTSEGNENGPLISFRGQANEAYYHLAPADKRYYMDYTGCGNTFNANHPFVTKYIIEALEAWVTDYHVDGFRFDLGSVLSRGPDGAPMSVPPVLWGIELSRVLSTVKVIAEAWDAGGLYQVGNFPGERWCVWNGEYRDTIRDFLRGEPGIAGDVATRIAGSSDLFAAKGEKPTNSINFVTCHDGFTLNDLVSYDGKHNEANGEGNRDGADDNRSWNCGVEGPSDDPAVEDLRRRQIKNAAAILLLSRGTPMILGGDEFRRSQAGNNNAYCQDGDLSWYDWSLADKNDEMIEFFAGMIQFRKRFSALRHNEFFEGRINHRGLRDLSWQGCGLDEPNWSDAQSRVLSFTLAGFDDEPDLHVIMNMWDMGLDFALPQIPGRRWARAIDTARSSPDDIVAAGSEPRLTGESYPAWGRSVVVLLSKEDTVENAK
jgi:isoamylase